MTKPANLQTSLVRGAVGMGVVVAGAIVIVRCAGSRGPTPTIGAVNIDHAADQAARAAATAAVEAASKKQAEEAASARAAVIDETRAKSSGLGRKDREKWIFDCVEKDKCDQATVDAIIAGAGAVEEDHARRASWAAAVQSIARTQGKDGETISVVPAGMISGVVAQPNNGLAMFDLLEKTGVGEAQKDPDTARGKTMKISGNIVEIRTKDGLTEGALATGNMVFVRFVTSMTTGSLVAGSWASFTGVFLQEYAYPNVSGGQTRSLLVVGAFDLPPNRTATNLPERRLARPAAPVGR